MAQGWRACRAGDIGGRWNMENAIKVTNLKKYYGDVLAVNHISSEENKR
jgi:hypothetical protein